MINSTSTCASRGGIASPLTGSSTITSAAPEPRRSGTRTYLLSGSCTRPNGKPMAPLSLLAITTRRSSITETREQRTSAARSTTVFATCSTSPIINVKDRYLHGTQRTRGHQLVRNQERCLPLPFDIEAVLVQVPCQKEIGPSYQRIPPSLP